MTVVEFVCHNYSKKFIEIIFDWAMIPAKQIAMKWKNHSDLITYPFVTLRAQKCTYVPKFWLYNKKESSTEFPISSASMSR